MELPLQPETPEIDDLKHQRLDPKAKLFKLPQIKVRSFRSEALRLTRIGTTKEK